MKTILYAAVTANGNYGDSDAGQMPKQEELNDLFNHAKEAGNIVMGRRTYEIFGGDDTFAGLDVVVVSRTASFEGVKTVASLQEMLNYLGEKGYPQAFVIGGVTLHNALLTEGLIDELYINIESYIAKGLDLGPTDDRFIELELIDHQHIGAGIVQIHYRTV
ncbi:dihydrofolate reductase family protein [Negadavirga shengliensis]|uniref:Dihydrofolate reductase family protein n=1 Tax=Negadavirga shengliensis TaxID=1389218 RepID=A0ABV9T4K6_9BACT